MRGLRVLKLAVAAAVAGIFMASGSAQAETVYGLTAANNIFSFDSANPGALLSGKFISGLQANESIVAIDVRPSNGLIYGIGSANRVYTINPSTGVAASVATMSQALSGVNFDMDFNPVSDAIRVISDTGMNIRVNPSTGLVTTDTNINASYANPNISGAAYTNNVVGAVTTTLYTIDSQTDFLNTQIPPNDGTQAQVGSLKDSLGGALNVTALNGFDISGSSGTAFVVIQQGSTSFSQFSSLNLGTGVLNNVTIGNASSGQIGGGFPVVDIAVVGSGEFVPEPASLGLVGLAALGLVRRRRA